MRKLFTAIALVGILLGGGAKAELPKQVIAKDVVTLQPGESRTFEFAESITKIGTAVAGIAEITAQTDRTFTIAGIAPGETLLMAHDVDGQISQMMVVVAFPGSIVKIYGTKNEEGETQDYVTFWCNSGTCGRADQDKAKPGSKSVTVTKVNRRGETVQTTKAYP